MPKMYRARHILVSEADDLNYIMDKLNHGESFEKLAEEFSECDTAAIGGNLGRFQSGTMVPEFEKALYMMEVGEIKSGVKTKFGYHIILREE